MMVRQLNSPFWRFTAEPEGQLDQLGSCRGRATAACQFRRFLERLQRVLSARVAPSARCRAVSSGSCTTSARCLCVSRRCAGVAEQ